MTQASIWPAGAARIAERVEYQLQRMASQWACSTLTLGSRTGRWWAMASGGAAEGDIRPCASAKLMKTTMRRATYRSCTASITQKTRPMERTRALVPGRRPLRSRSSYAAQGGDSSTTNSSTNPADQFGFERRFGAPPPLLTARPPFG